MAFIAVEGTDRKNPDKVIENSCKEIEKVAGMVKVKNIVLYAFVRLFPESVLHAEFSLDMIKKIENNLKNKFSVYSVPFGWYKMHEYRCLGHPLSELSRTIRTQE